MIFPGVGVTVPFLHPKLVSFKDMKPVKFIISKYNQKRKKYYGAFVVLI